MKKISIGVFLIPLLLLAPWLCPQRCLYPNTIPWGNNFTEVGHQLVFSTLLLGLLAVWATTIIRTRRFELRKCPVTVSLTAIFLLGILQLVPLPRAVLKLVSPTTVEMRERLLPNEPEMLNGGQKAVAASSSGQSVISLNPEATRAQLTDLLAALLLFAVVRNCLATPSSLRRLSVVILINGALIALFGLFRYFQPGGTRYLLYGVYATNHMTFGTFLNRNHFAFYMNICLGLGLGVLLALSRESTPAGLEDRFQKRSRSGEHGHRLIQSALDFLQNPTALGVCLALALMAVSIVFCQSRGGLLALVGAAGVTLGVKLHRSWARRSEDQGEDGEHEHRRAPTFGLEASLLAIAIALGLTSWLGFDWLQTRLVTTVTKGDPLKESRVTTLARAWPLVRDFPVFGTGFGTFYTVQPLPWSSAENTKEIRDAHALNEYLEAAVEGGILRLLLTLVLIIAVFVVASRAYRRYQNEPTGGLVLGAIFALTAVAIHSAVEFGIHMPAITMLVIVVVAMVSGLGAKERERSDPKRESATSAGLPLITPLIGAVTVVGLGFLLFANGWKENQLRKVDYGGSNPETLTLEQNLERVPILEAGLRLAPRNDALHVELGRTHLRIYEQKTAEHTDRESARLATETVLALAGPTSVASVPGGWALVLAPVSTNLLVREQAKPALDHAAQEHLLPSLNHYIQARDLSPLNVQSHLGIAVNADYLARGDSFDTYLNRAKFLRPADPELWYRCGLLELNHQYREAAWASWRHSLTLANTHLVDIVDQSMNSLSARELAEKVLPDDPNMLLAVASAFFGKPERAAEQQILLEHALGLLDEKKTLSADDARVKSRVYHLLGMEELALASFKEAIGKAPDKIEYRFEYASVLFQQGRYQDCRRELAQIISLQPEHTQARELLNSAMKLMDSSKESEGMVAEALVDFGVIPHGTKLRHRFKITNTTKATMHVSGTRSSCGCARAAVERTEIPPGEAMNVLVTLDSGRFTGPRTYTYYIDFDEPTPREIRLFARANSRTELVVDPPELILDKQDRSEGIVRLTHHGSGTWRIVSAEADNGALVTEVHEVGRSEKQTVYQLRVRTVASTTVGNVDVWLKTSDASLPRVRVPVTIKAADRGLAILPDPLDLGRVTAGATVERKIVVRGSKPFKIQTIEGTDDGCKITGGTTESKPLQVLSVAFRPGGQPGPFERRFKVVTDLGGAVAEFTIKGEVAK